MLFEAHEPIMDIYKFFDFKYSSDGLHFMIGMSLHSILVKKLVFIPFWKERQVFSSFFLHNFD